MNILRKIKKKIENKNNMSRNKSYRRKYMCYYALTFITPILVIFMANIYSSQIIKKQTLQSNQKVLKQFLGLVEEEMNKIVKDVYSITTDWEIQQYAELAGQEMNWDLMDKKINILDKLKSYCGESGYEDVFIWYPDVDLVISGWKVVTDSTNLETYSTTYYDGNDHFQTEIGEGIKRESLSIKLWPVKKDEQDKYFAVSTNRFRNTSKLKNYQLTLIVNGGFIENCIGEGVLIQSENAMLFNKDGELVYSYKHSGTEFLSEEYRSSGTYVIEKNGKKSTFLVQESEIIEGYYAIEIPYDEFYMDLYNVQKISYLGIFISVFIGLLVTYRMSNSTYRPLEEALARFQEKIDWSYEPQKNSEFEFLTEVLEQKEKEHATTHIKEKENNDKRRKRLLLIALEGREMNEGEIEFLETQVTFLTYFYGGMFRLKNCGKVGWELMSFVVTNIFEELFQEEYSCDIISVAFNKYVIVLNQSKEVDEERINTILKKGIDFLEQYLDVSVQFGMGNVCEGLYNLHNMYRQGQYALEYRFFKDKESIFLYRDVQGRSIEVPFSEETPMSNRINEFIKQEDAENRATELFLEEIIKTYGIHDGSSIETVDYFKHEVFKTLNNIWIKCDMEYMRRQYYTSQLNEADSLSCYTECLRHAICETAQEFKKNKYKNRLAAQIKKYVDENYMDADLSVSSIGDVFGMQAAYLSKIFREEYGTLILNYISTKRIHSAKQLLEESRMNINEIAEATGFLSGNVFIKTFKKHTGLTPGKYRSTLMSDKT